VIPYKKNKFVRAVGLNKAIELAEKDFSFNSVPLQRKDFLIEPTGEFMIQGTQFPISEGGIRNICSMLKIPDPFAERIPTDLFIANVNRLLKEKPENRVNAYFSPEENILIDTNEKVNLQPIPTSRLLTQLEDSNEIRVFFENHFAKVETVPTSGLQVEVKGEIHSIGNTIFHYPTCKSVPQGYLTMMTMICKNGAIAPRNFLREKLNIKSSSDADLLIRNFIEKIGKVSMGKELLEERFKSLHNTTFSLKEMKKLFHTTKRAVGVDEIANVLGNDFMNSYEQVKQIDEDVDTDANRYKTYYQMTYYASNITNSARVSRKFQSLAGKLLLTDEL
jgi:hypothetical protein